MKKLLAFIFVSLLLTGSAFAGNTYNQYGSRTGAYRTNGSTTTTYDRYGSRTGSYKTKGNTTTKFAFQKTSDYNFKYYQEYATND